MEREKIALAVTSLYASPKRLKHPIYVLLMQILNGDQKSLDAARAFWKALNLR